MGQKLGQQAQQQASKVEHQQQASAATGRRTEDPMDVMQALLGTRAASRQFRAEWQHQQNGETSQPHPMHQLLQSVTPVSPRSQGKPTFRGVSHEWGGASSGLVVQPKLMIGEPNDRYEQEADRVAQQVVQQIQTPDTAQPVSDMAVQQQGEEDLQRKSELQLMGDPAGVGMTASGELESAIRQVRGAGVPLPETVREPMERSFGTDFSRVRIHANAKADQLNRSISAKAFTTGQDVFLRQGAYQPRSREGQELLAHEFAHVVQQQRVPEHANALPLQRKVFINGVQKTANDISELKDKKVAREGNTKVKNLITDKKERYFEDMSEVNDYVNGKTENIGYVDKEDLWIRFIGRYYVLGENHVATTLQDITRATGVKRWIYEGELEDRGKAVITYNPLLPNENAIEFELPKIVIGLHGLREQIKGTRIRNETMNDHSAHRLKTEYILARMALKALQANGEHPTTGRKMWYAYYKTHEKEIEKALQTKSPDAFFNSEFVKGLYERKSSLKRLIDIFEDVALEEFELRGVERADWHDSYKKYGKYEIEKPYPIGRLMEIYRDSYMADRIEQGIKVGMMKNTNHLIEVAGVGDLHRENLAHILKSVKLPLPVSELTGNDNEKDSLVIVDLRRFFDLNRERNKESTQIKWKPGINESDESGLVGSNPVLEIQ